MNMMTMMMMKHLFHFNYFYSQMNKREISVERKIKIYYINRKY